MRTPDFYLLQQIARTTPAKTLSKIKSFHSSSWLLRFTPCSTMTNTLYRLKSGFLANKNLFYDVSLLSCRQLLTMNVGLSQTRTCTLDWLCWSWSRPWWSVKNAGSNWADWMNWQRHQWWLRMLSALPTWIETKCQAWDRKKSHPKFVPNLIGSGYIKEQKGDEVWSQNATSRK